MRPTPQLRAVICVGPPTDAVGGVARCLSMLADYSAQQSTLTWHFLTPGVGLNVRQFVRAFRAVRRRLRAEGVLVYLSVASRGSFARKSMFGWLAKRRAVPYVIHLHGAQFDQFFDGASPWLQQLILRFFRHATKVIVLGEYWRDFVTTVLHVSPGAVTVLPNAVYGPSAGPVTQSVPQVVFLGRIGRRKGVYDLLSALGQLLDLEWQAVLAGDGDVDSVRIEISRRGLGSRVTTTTLTRPSDVSALLSSSSIFVLPSYAEGLPLALLEAMAHGLICVVSPVGSIPDVIEDGRNGVLVPAGEVVALAQTLRGILARPDDYRKLGQAAYRTWARSYDARYYGERLSGVLSDAYRTAALWRGEGDG